MKVGLCKCIFITVLVSLLSSHLSADTDENAGKNLFEKRCHKCHELPDPSNPPPEGWKLRLDKMAKFARLKEPQKQDVLAFLQRHSKDEFTKKVVANDQQLLEEKCSVCHTLGRIELENFDGDTGKHILDRMQSYADTSNINNDDLKRILNYLQAPNDLPKPQRIETEDPAELFKARCTACHSLERVFNRMQSNDTTDAVWTHIVSRMRDKAPEWITDKEAKVLLVYLKSLDARQ